ncbi:MAG: hypothetical protein ACXWV6_04420 [Chitinophagaceae bacterium]
MKPKTSIALLCVFLTANVVSTYATTIDNGRPTKERTEKMNDEQKKSRLEDIRTRVSEIKEIDKSGLSKTERKAMRKELRGLKKESKDSKGVYLSVGAIIIIILLLILIL